MSDVSCAVVVVVVVVIVVVVVVFVFVYADDFGTTSSPRRNMLLLVAESFLVCLLPVLCW